MEPIERQVFVCVGHRCIGDGDGGQSIYHRLRKKLARQGMLHDGNLPGNVRVTRIQCTAGCGRGPMMIVYPEGVFYSHVALADLDRIIDRHLVGNEIVGDKYFFRSEPAQSVVEPAERPAWLGLNESPVEGLTPQAEEEDPVPVDRVCGMSVDGTDAKQTFVYAQKTYYFCSPACKKAFGREPAKYLDPAYRPSM